MHQTAFPSTKHQYSSIVCHGLPASPLSFFTNTAKFHQVRKILSANPDQYRDPHPQGSALMEALKTCHHVRIKGDRK